MLEWITANTQVPYEEAVSFMEERVEAIRKHGGDEAVWLVEHPPLYTAGTSAQDKDLLDQRFPVYTSGRGGEYTYHGPGQRVAYVMLDLQKRQSAPDLKAYIYMLEEWIIRSLADFGVTGERREGRVGIWVRMEDYGGPAGAESKIAAIGVRIRRWVTYHGVAINIDPDLSHFDGIVPCGIANHGVTSLTRLLGKEISFPEFDESLRKNGAIIFEKS